MHNTDLTKSQQKALNFIERFFKNEGRSPTLHEIAKGVGLSSVSTVHKHVVNLIDKGFLERRKGYGNNIVRRPAAAESGGQEMKALPFYGDVAAGTPSLPESYAVPMDVPHAIHRNKENLFVLRAVGDSMVEDSILNGDYVVLQRRGEYLNGDRVVALIDREEVTLKELRRDRRGIWLIPHNPELAPKHYDAGRVEVQGVLVGVMRSC